MKARVVLVGLWMALAFCAYGQEAVDSLVNEGIRHHDAGEYDRAVELYQQALEINPDAPVALYELSVTLIGTGDYISAIRYCDRLIGLNNEYSPLAYSNKGSCLNYLKDTNQAIRVFIEGINKYEDVALLHFNLALAYFTSRDFPRARDSFIDAIYLDPHYAGSHLNLARTMVNLGQWPEALLCFYYFLLLENNGNRAAIAYESIVEQLLIDSTFMEVFVTKTNKFMESMKARKDDGTMTDIWADFYIPFFEAAADKEYTETLCYYISLYFNRDANYWGKRNEAKLADFASWMENW